MTQTSTQPAVAQAAVHGYVTAFWWPAGIVAVGAAVAGALLSARVPGSAGSTQAVAP